MMRIWTGRDSLGSELFSRSRVVGGFSVPEIEMLCDDALARKERRAYSPVPWLFWGSEHYSFGRCYREISGYPRWLPIAVNSDHGFAAQESLVASETTNPARVHLIWSIWRVGHWNIEKGFHRTLHPWVGFRRLRGLRKTPSAQGTLVFLPHSAESINIWEDDDGWGDLVARSLQLPPQFHPIVLCIQMHDVRKGRHRGLIEEGHQVITFGETTSPFFVERFYEGLLGFEFSTSNSLGSHAFLSQEAGVDFFTLGEKPAINYAVIAEARGQTIDDFNREAVSEYRHREEECEAIFSQFPPRKSTEKDRLIRESLSTDLTTLEAAWALRKLLSLSLFPSAFVVVKEYARRLYARRRLASKVI